MYLQELQEQAGRKQAGSRSRQEAILKVVTKAVNYKSKQAGQGIGIKKAKLERMKEKKKGE